MPVAAPVSADWSASPGVHIGSAPGVRPWHVARFDPATGKLTALRAGAPVLLAVTVNGVQAEATVTTAVPRPAPPPAPRAGAPTPWGTGPGPAASGPPRTGWRPRSLISRRSGLGLGWWGESRVRGVGGVGVGNADRSGRR